MTPIQTLDRLALENDRMADDAARRNFRDGGATVRHFQRIARDLRGVIAELERQFSIPFEFKGKWYHRVGYGRIVQVIKPTAP